MNERNSQAGESRDELFVARAKKLFDRSVDGLDANARSRLNRSRHEALAQIRPGMRYGQWLRWAPAAGVTAAAVVAFVLWAGRSPIDDLTATAEASDFEILLTEESLEMLEELDFYTWIELDAGLGDEADASGNVG